MIGTVDVAQQPVKHVKHDHRTRITQMRAIINCRSADIHPHIFGIDRRENLFFTGLRVIQLDRRHKFLTRSWRGLINFIGGLE